MIKVKVMWMNKSEGGRKSPPPIGRYFPIAKFSNNEDSANLWSIILDLEAPQSCDEYVFSYGTAEFLSEDAPKDKLEIFDSFYIYEGPHKVGKVFIEAKR
ncbi:hypothetical protein [Vibrio spartinae]|uniref:Uncharacterized protein n=1 Tax=Vibrio spartinae TaxID=1918945 RepID=A0A1N6M031_9VIBR|nr:hypothetical protein [Vibrio spartinae]SIO92799.1 hypothetical protein VSP9026_00420 [Vibrio spartinae]